MSNLTLRILTAVIAIPIILLICIAGGIYFFGFVAIAAAVALHEFYTLAKLKGANPQVGLGIFAGFLIQLSFFHEKLQLFLAGFFDGYGVAIPFPSESQLLLIVILLTVAAASVHELFRNKGSAVMNLAVTLLGILYVSLFFGSFVGIREMFSASDPAVTRHFMSAPGIGDAGGIYRAGGYTVISVFALIWICDSAAFHVGVAIGKHKLFPRVSPNKSWEGAVAGFLFAVGAAVAAKYLVLPYLSLGSALILGCIVGIFGQIGDLIESLLKRDAGVKDSSALIPGHGGAFDRFDSLLLVAPLVYFYLDFIVF